MLTFKKGIHIKDEKFLSKNANIEQLPAPKTVFIPLLQHIGVECEPVVKMGDIVKKGQIIATSSKMSSNVIASVSGKILDIVLLPNAQGRKIKHLPIENDGLETEQKLPILKNPKGADIVKRIKDAGIVGMGGAAFPSHIKATPANDKQVETLIINAAECEPYITCDYRIMTEYPEEFLKGCLLLKEAACAKEVVVAIEDNKEDIAKILQEYNMMPIILLRAKYPQGSEKQLIYAVTKKKVPIGKLPMDVNVIVNNVHTAYAVYQAVYEGKASYERVVTISGRAIEKPKNLLIRTGTQYSEVIDFCGGLKEQPKKIISGGPMMGFSQFSTQAVVAKGTSCILFLKEEEVNTKKAMACINCSRCANSCPINLLPMYIDGYCLAGELELSKKYGALSCVECGCCSYVCPSKRPLVQSIKLAKKLIKERNI